MSGLTLGAAIDVALLKLSEAKPGDVLVIKCQHWSDGNSVSRALAQVVRDLPAGSLPACGVPVLISSAGDSVELQPAPSVASETPAQEPTQTGWERNEAREHD